MVDQEQQKKPEFEDPKKPLYMKPTPGAPVPQVPLELPDSLKKTPKIEDPEKPLYMKPTPGAPVPQVPLELPESFKRLLEEEQEKPRDPRNTIQPVRMAVTQLPNQGFASPEPGVAQGLVANVTAKAYEQDASPFSAKGIDLKIAELGLSYNKQSVNENSNSADHELKTPNVPEKVIAPSAKGNVPGGPN